MKLDQHTRENWQRIKEALEAAGKTNCYFYKRAISILVYGVDPLK